MLTLTESKARIEPYLEKFLKEKVEKAKELHPSYQQLLEEIMRVTLAGGKRLRPHLVFVGYGSDADEILPVAAAHELLHTALLVHDDIIDRDIIRHDQPTIHHQYNTSHYVDHLDNGDDRLHFSTSAAILAGDILISFAYELLAAADLPADARAAAAATMAQGIFEVAGGELLDTEAAFVQTSKDPLLIYKHKTASYSFVSPLLSGARLSPVHNNEKTIELLHTYAINTGIAYQIHDDIIGVFGDESVTGKSTTGDLKEGKQTLLMNIFQENASAEQLRLMIQTFGNTLAETTELLELKNAIGQSGALEATTEIEQEYANNASLAVEQLGDPQLKQHLNELTALLMKRKA